MNTATGTTLNVTAAVDSHATWLKVTASRASAAPGSTVGGAAAGLLQDGTLWTWGSNSQSGFNGHIAQGNNDNPYYVPTQVGTDTDWVDACQGDGGGLAVKQNGTLWAWGYDFAGQLGSGTLGTVMYTPTQIGTDTDWAKVVTARGSSLLMKQNGTIWTMGSNDFYRTGLGLNSGNTLVPTQIGTDTDWVRVVQAARGGLGIKSNGELWSWGTDQNGALCQGVANNTYPTPTRAGLDSDWAYVATNGFTAFGLSFLIKRNGTLWTAGSNREYGTGRGINTGDTIVVTQVGIDNDWKQICCGQGTLLYQPAITALKTNGKIYSWGLNLDGRTAQGTSTGNTTVPMQIGTENTWVRIGDSGSGYMTLFIKS